MNNTMITRKKLFTLFTVLGIFNIIMAYGFFYFSSIELLEQRSTQQMASARAQASQKLSLYLENLKYSSEHGANDFYISGKTYDSVLKGSLTGVYFQDSNDSVTVLRGALINKTVFNTVKEQMKFYPLSNDSFMLKVSHVKGSLLFTFDFDGINEVLTEYEGMGESGEIYLVGQDNIIRSASRHSYTGASIVVDNASVELGKQLTSGVHTVRDYRDVKVLSAFSPFKFDNLNLILLSEIDMSEVMAPLNSLFPQVFLICLSLCLFSIVLAYFLSTKIVSFLEEMKPKGD